jgi:hypothetical protein
VSRLYPQDKTRNRTTTMSLLPVEPAWRLADRAGEQRWLVTSLWSTIAGRHKQIVELLRRVDPKQLRSSASLSLRRQIAALGAVGACGLA